MKKPYHHIRLKQGTPQWKAWRHESGLGGSEVSSALAMTSQDLADQVYQSPLKLFLEKLAEPVQQFTGNESSEEGKWQENSIIERFVYYNLERPEQMGIYENRRLNQKMNGVIRPNNVIQNEKYPWLFYSPDAFMTERPRSRNAVAALECKLTTSMESKRYEAGVNPAHFLQLQTGLMITEFKLGYILSLVDGKWFKAVPVEADKEIQQWIADTTADFWMRVVKARKYKIEYGIPAYFGVNPELLTDKQREGAALIAQLEPALIGTNHELQFIKDMIVNKAEVIAREGTQDEWESAVAYQKACEEASAGEAKKKKYYGEMLRTLNGSNTINFNGGENGFYSYKPDKNGKTSLYVSPKIKGE